MDDTKTKLDIKSLLKSVTSYISLTMLTLIVVIITTVALLQEYRQKHLKDTYTKQINNTIEHTVNHYFNDYSNFLNRIIKIQNLATMLKNGDRESMYKKLAPIWKLMEEEDKYLEILQIHLADGTSFLRVHKPEVYGDNLMDIRPMIKEIHRSHKIISGYETGLYSTPYRIIYPIFDKQHKYLGAIEIGINPNFILCAIKDINNFDGMVFIKADSLLKPHSPNDRIMNNYILQSKLTPKLRKIYKIIKTSNQLKNNFTFEVEGISYTTHLFEIKDFQNQTKVKIIFFQDTSKMKVFNNYFLTIALILIGIMFLLLVWLVSRRISLYQESVTKIYEEQIYLISSSEKKLQSSQLEFDLFMYFIPAKILIKEQDGTIVYANIAANQFFRQEELVGKKAVDILPPELAKDEDKFDAKVIKYGKYEEIREFYTYENEKIIVRTLGFKIDIGETIQIGVVMLDITQSYLDKIELENQEEIMIAQSRHAAMGEMISMIAHQWRQPISVIAMDANNILADIELEILDEEQLKNGSEDIIKQTQELSKTIDDFRNFFRPSRISEEILVQDIIKDAMGVIGKSLNNNNIEVILKLGEAQKIKTYSRELMQVLINIVKNAKEVLQEKDIEYKKISIDIETQTDSLTIIVCDNGGGVKEENMEKIFDPYFTTKGEKNGTGLGLYMSRTIIEKHLEGSLSVKNSDEGACFNITIPHAIEDKEEKK